MNRIFVGAGDFRYEVVPDWARLPSGETMGIISGVAVDSQDRIYVYARGAHPVMIFGHDGNYQGSWGQELIMDAHGIHIDSNDAIYLADRDAHEIIKSHSDGRILMRLGRRGWAASEEPFNHPTAAAVAANGDIFVADGYANSKVHKYDAQGNHLLSWGRPGAGPGEFRVPHAVWVSRQDRVYICDRDNCRVQIFDTSGSFIEEWTDYFRPTSIFIDREDTIYITDLSSRLSILRSNGTLITRLRILADGGHAVWGDSQGNLYVVEIHQKRIDKYLKVS